ncbi:hypothetical protein [Gemmatimonas sp.]|uniref:hypothetical protein n=1 Tax=Gemmatimonas sp. TaxID=1962908 RepID=UPI002ED8F882
MLSQIRLLQEQALPAVRKFLGTHRPSPTYAMQLHADAPDQSIRLAFQPSGLPASTNGGTLMIDVAPETLAFRAQFAGGPGQMPYSYFLPPIKRTEVEHTAIIDRIQCFVEDGIDYFRLLPAEPDFNSPASVRYM